MNQFSNKYEAKPEEYQVYTKKKNSKKLLKNYFFNGGDNKDDIIIRQIIQHTQNVPFTEADAKTIKGLYGKISEAKRNLFNDDGIFTTQYNSKTKKEEPSNNLPTHTIEIRKEAHQAYKGAVLYLAKKDEIRKLLKTGFMNQVRSDEAIKAYKLLEECGDLYADLFYRTYPTLAEYLDTNLPVELRQQNKSAFQRGFTRYNYEEQDKKTIEAGEKDPSKYVAPKVVRDNLIALFNQIEKTLKQEENQPGTRSGLDVLLAIVVEAGLENDKLTTMLNSAKLPPKRLAYLKAKYPTVFAPNTLNTVTKGAKKRRKKKQEADRAKRTDQIQDGVSKGTENMGMIDSLIEERGALRIAESLAKGISFWISGKQRFSGVDLSEFQVYGAGTLGGMKFSDKESEGYSSKEYQEWLDSKGVFQTDKNDKSKIIDRGDRKDRRKAGKLAPSEINIRVDTHDQKKGEKHKNDKHFLKAFANELPFDSFDMLSGDSAFRSDAGTIKHLYAHISWQATRGKDEKKNQLADIKLLIKEVLFNNFRVVFGKETYSFGRIHVENIEVDMKQVLENAGNKIGALTGLYDLLMNPNYLTIALVMHIIARFKGKEAMQATGKDAIAKIAAGPMGFTNVTLNVGKIDLENFYSTSMGGIGKIGLGKTKLTLKSTKKTDSNSDAPYADTNADSRKELIEKKEEYKKLLHKQNKKKTKDPDLETKLTTLASEIKTLETTLHANDEYKTNYEIELSTKAPVVMKDAQLLQDMMREMLLSSFKDSGLTLEGLEGLTDIELPEGLTLGALASASAVKDLTLDVPKIKIPTTLKAKRFQYNMQETNEEGKVKKDSKGNDLVSLVAIGTGVSIEGIELDVNVAFNDLEVNTKEDKEEGMLKNVIVNELFARSFRFKNLTIKMPEPSPTKTDDNTVKDPKETLAPPAPQKLHDVAVFNTAAEVSNIKLGVNMQEKTFNINFDKLIAQEDKKNIQIDSEFASKDKSGELNEKTQLLLKKVEKLEFKVEKDGTMTAKVGNVTVPQVVLQKFGFKNDTIAISHDQDDDRKVKTTIEKVELQNLELEMKGENYYIKKLDKLSIVEVFMSGKVTYKGDTIPLKNGSIKGIEATNLAINIEDGKSILQMVEKGSASIEKLNLPKVVYATVGNLDLFDIGNIKIDRITEEGKEGIDYSVGSIKVKGGGKASGKNITGEFSTTVGGKYTEDKDHKGSISTTLTDTNIDTEVKNKKGKKEAAAKISAKTISLDTDMKTYATLSLGASLNLERIFYEAADGTYVKNVPGGTPLQLMNPRAKVTFVKKEVTNKQGTKELKTVAYKVDYFNVDKIVGRNLEAGNLKTGKKLLESNDKQLSLDDLHVSGIYYTSGKAFTINANTKQFKLTELKSDLVSGFKLNTSFKSTSISFSQKEKGTKDLTVKLNQMEVGTSNEDKSISGKLKTNNITIKSDLSNYVTLSLGKALEVSHLHYEDKKGNYIKTLEPNKSPVKLVKPVARLKIVKNKKNKVTAYKLEYLNIDKITAGNLEVHQIVTPKKKPDDILEPKPIKTTLKLSDEQEVTIQNIHLEGKIETSNNDFEVEARADSFDIKKLQVTVENKLKTYTYLSTGKLSYKRELYGDHTATVNDLDVGLLKRKGKGHEILPLTGFGGIDLNKHSKDDHISIFNAKKIRYGTFGDESFVVLTDPQIGPLVIEGKFMQDTGNYFKEVQINKLIIKGGVEGDMIVRDSPEKLTLEAFQDIMISIPEADLEANSLSNLLNFGKNREEDEAKAKKKKDEAKKKEKEKWQNLPPIPPMVQDGVKQPPIIQPLTNDQIYNLSLDGRAESYKFLGAFGGSHLTVKLLDKVVKLKVKNNDPAMPTIQVLDFFRELADAALEYFVRLFLPGVLQGTVIDAKPEMLKEGIQSLRTTFEGDFKDAFNNDGSMILPYFAVMGEELAADPAKYINGIIDAALSKYIERIREEERKRKDEDSKPLEDLVSALLSEGYEEIAKAVVNSIFSDDGEPEEISSRLVPEIVDEILENLNLELILDAKVKQRQNSPYHKFGKSALEPGGFKGHSSVAIKFVKVPDQTAQKFHIDSQISVSNTNFSGFSLPIKSAKGNGNVSTREMNISELKVKKQSFEDNGKVSLKAKNIYLKGLQLEFNKKQLPKTDNTKKKKGN